MDKLIGGSSIKSNETFKSIMYCEPISTQDFPSLSFSFSSTSTTSTILNDIEPTEPSINSKEYIPSSPRSISESIARETVVRASSNPKLNEKYNIESVIGFGINGVVVSAINLLSNETVAIKLIYKNRLKTQIPNEIKMLSECENENIIAFIEWWQDSLLFYLVTEYVSKPCIKLDSIYIESLHKTIPMFSSGQVYIDDVWNVIIRICKGVGYLHSINISHGDIKRDNIVISDDACKLVDFGFACKADSKRAFYGSLAYSAPELLQIVQPSDIKLPPTDVWALGLVILTLVGGKISLDFAEMVQNGHVKEYPGLDFLTGQVGDLIRGMLSIDVSRRLTMDQVLAHSYFV